MKNLEKYNISSGSSFFDTKFKLIKRVWKITDMRKNSFGSLFYQDDKLALVIQEIKWFGLKKRERNFLLEVESDPSFERHPNVYYDYDKEDHVKDRSEKDLLNSICNKIISIEEDAEAKEKALVKKNDFEKIMDPVKFE